MLENLDEQRTRCTGICKASDDLENCSVIQTEISTFKDLIGTYQRDIQRKLGTLLPDIRGGSADESQLWDILKNYESSPFSILGLKSWIQEKENQVNIVTKFVKDLSEITFVPNPDDLKSKVMDPEHTSTICFTIQIPRDSKIEIMKKYIRNDSTSRGDHESADQKCSSSEGEYTDKDSSLMKKTKQFKQYVETNKDIKDTQFMLTIDTSHSKAFKAQIHHYEFGELVNSDFQLIFAPEQLTAVPEKCTHNSITFQWQLPQQVIENIKYRIKCEDVDEHKVVTVDDIDSRITKFTIPNLRPNCQYQVSVQSCGEDGFGPMSEPLQITTRPTSPPGKPEITQVSLKSVSITWSEPETVGRGCQELQYVVSQQEEGTTKWYVCQKIDKDNNIYEITPNLSWIFKVTAHCGTAGRSLDSATSDPFTVNATDSDIAKENVRVASTKLDGKGTCILVPKLKPLVNRQDLGIQKYELGVPKPGHPEKVVMMVGSTGSGKTTLINVIANYVFGVTWEDKFRFKLIEEPHEADQTESQTQYITSYTFHHQKGFQIPFTLTIVDTPGFGDAAGVARDRKITEQVRNFFETENGVPHIDAIGFVVKSGDVRLTVTQKYIFEQIMSLFGSDIADNIYFFTTHAGPKKPEVLKAIKKNNMKYVDYFKFDNLSFCHNDEEEEDDDDDDDALHKTWEMGTKSLSKLMEKLHKVESKSLTLTKEVLGKRHELQQRIMDIRKQLRSSLSNVEQIAREAELLEKHKEDLDSNKEFTYEAEEVKVEKKDLPWYQSAQVCQNCRYTCSMTGLHVPLVTPTIFFISHRAADACTLCPGNCSASEHEVCHYKYVTKRMKVTKVSQELKDKYMKTGKAKQTSEDFIATAQAQLKQTRDEILDNIRSMMEAQQQLNKIALRPKVDSVEEYIIYQVENERGEKKPGWEKRIENLQKLKRDTKLKETFAHAVSMVGFINETIYHEREAGGTGWQQKIDQLQIIRAKIEPQLEETSNEDVCD